MSKSRNWIARICALGLLLGTGSLAVASIQDATIVIDHALNSPTLTVRYNGAHVALVELRLNGVSFGTRSTDPGLAKGETNFTIDLSSLSSGNNDVEVRLYDKGGNLVGTEKSSVSADQGGKAPVFLQMPKVGSTVQGPISIAVGFGKELHNTYVSFFIDNQFKSMTNSAPFDYIWDTTRDANGWHDIEAWVVDDSSTTYKTRKVKIYVNNPGGNTYRQFTQPDMLAPTPAPFKVATVTPAPVVHPQLQTSVATPKVAVQGANGVKSTQLATASAAQRATKAVAPTVVQHPVAKHVAATLAINNEVHPEVGVASGVKTEGLANSVAIGPRMLLPTGKRVAFEASPAKPVLSGPIGPSGSHLTKAVTLPRAMAVAIPAAKNIPPLPKVNAATLAVVKSKSDDTISIKVINPEPKVAVVTAKVAPAAKPEVKVTAPAVKLTTPVKVAVKTAPTVQPTVKATTPAKVAPTVKAAAPTKVAIAHGTKLPNVGTYAIQLNAKTVKFDDVKPRVENNVPLTPFRYLFEQSGGKVKWTNQTKSVDAEGQGHVIYIKIGDKLARVNNLPIQLDLTPFIDHGRTIVPLSFIKDALDVEVDYDPVTNHVLITSIKKKH
jgi:Copper amine oxidase N-terminal domain